jgi:hypothetical protein
VPAAYHFVDHWFVPAPVEEVYDVIGEPLEYPRCWGDVFLEMGGDPGPPRPGRHTTILPYRLRFESNVVAAERPRSIEMTLSGDFEGGGSWNFEAAEGGTRAVLNWRPVVNKPLVKNLTPVLRPLFRANHTWTMKRGERHIAEYLKSRARGLM